jgi:hypothetical protein
LGRRLEIYIKINQLCTCAEITICILERTESTDYIFSGEELIQPIRWECANFKHIIDSKSETIAILVDYMIAHFLIFFSTDLIVDGRIGTARLGERGNRNIRFETKSETLQKMQLRSSGKDEESKLRCIVVAVMFSIGSFSSEYEYDYEYEI